MFPHIFKENPNPNDPSEKKKDDSILGRLITWAPEMMLMLTEIYSEYVASGYKLNVPESVKQRVNEEKESTNPLERFISTELRKEPGCKIHTHKIAEKYAEWLISMEEKDTTTNTSITKRLETMNLGVSKGLVKIKDCKTKSKITGEEVDCISNLRFLEGYSFK